MPTQSNHPRFASRADKFVKLIELHAQPDPDQDITEESAVLLAGVKALVAWMESVSLALWSINDNITRIR